MNWATFRTNNFVKIWGVPLVRPSRKNIFLYFQIIWKISFTIQFYYKKEDVCKKLDPYISKIGRVTRDLRNWPISDQFFQISKSRPIFEIGFQFVSYSPKFAPFQKSLLGVGSSKHSFTISIGGAPGAPPGISLIFKTPGITGLRGTASL